MSADRSRVTHALPATAFVILGMLRLGAETGYDVKQAVQVSTRFFWTISEAQIYPSLAQLEELGLIAGRDASHGRRRRRAYTVTAGGEAALREWLLAREPLPFEVRDVAMLRLFFADAVGEEGGREIVRRFRERSVAELDKLQVQLEPALELAAETGNRFPALSLRAGIAVHEALIAAADEIEADL